VARKSKVADLPTIPPDPKVIELGEYNAPRTCRPCGADAEFYIIVTNEMYNQREGTDLGPDQWPVNSFLCRDCFADAPRVKDWSALPLKREAP